MEGTGTPGRYGQDDHQGSVGHSHGHRGRGRGRGRGRNHGKSFGRGSGHFRGRGRGGQVNNSGDYVEDGNSHSEDKRSHPNRVRSDRGRGRGRGRQRGHRPGHAFALSHQRSMAGSRQRHQIVVGPSHAESLAWIQGLKGFSSDDLVDAIENDLKQFQTFINSDCNDDLKELSTVISILVQLSQCSVDKKEAANRVLAECISDRCEQFHLRLLRSVQQVSHKQDRHSINHVLLLVNLCCALLDQFHYAAMTVLPVMDIQREVQTLVRANPSEAKLQSADEELSVRIDQIATSEIDLGQVEGKPIHGHSHEDEEELYTFSTTIILPDPDELRSREVPKLTPNIIEGRYKSWDHYYNTQFHLLREDFVAPLRQGICDYMMGLRGRDLQDVRVYNGIRILLPEFDRQGVSYLIQFDTDRLKYVKWHRSKRLIYGSLVCLSSDDFTRNIVFASISNRDADELQKGLVQIKPEGDSAFLLWDTHQEYTMVESSAYYEAYRHILSSLQSAEVDTMPFKQYLVNVDCEEVGQPTYLNHLSEPPVYDLSSALKCACPSVKLTDDNSWPEASSTQLDNSQLKAMKMALTQDVALIQGPPGTGKTYMGIKIVEALVHNRRVWDPTSTSPILVVCFTNHALDQFLNGIKLIEVEREQRAPFRFREKSIQPIRIVRVGGRADESMANYALRNIRKGTLPMSDFIALKEQRADLDDEAQSLTLEMEAEYFAHANVLGLQELFGVIPHDQCLQILSICEPSPGDPPNLQILVWLGLRELCQQNEDCSNVTESRELQMAAESDGMVRYDNEETGGDEEQSPTDEHDECTTEDGATVPAISSCSVGNESDGAHTKEIQDPNQQVLLDLADKSFTEDDAPDNLETGHNSPTDNPMEEMDEDKLVDVEDEVAFEQEQRRLYMGDEEDRQRPKFSQSVLKRVEPVDTEQGHSANLAISRPVMDWKRKKSRLLQCSPMNEAEVNNVSDVLKLTERDRWCLYTYWVECLKDRRFRWQFEQFNNACLEYREMDQQQDRHALEQVHVIGMTTTGTAKYQHVLHMVKPKIVIVEEAAEVLESHIVSCLTASTQHLILIGDHQQLRPKPNVYELAKKCNLDISLFERLVRNDFPRVTLEIQHRMRPEIAELVHPLIYPVLENHESVCGYENIKGMSKNMFFIDHCELEKPNDELRSHSNIHEAKFLAALCRYLIRQEYRPEQITVLCAYTGQLFEVQKHMPRREFNGVKVRTLDNYQGEENDIVLLSLVRSNTAKKIGFLRAEHRVCVALSRAKMGFYCIGNFQLLRREGEIWERLVPILEKKNLIGPMLSLCCENHPDTATEIKTAEDFSKVPEGGCSLDCAVRLDCGHSCGLKCHSYDRAHVRYKCQKMCAHICSLGHACQQRCHYPEPCSPCKEQVEKVIPSCGHNQFMPCSQDPAGIDVLCTTMIDVTCKKDHVVHKKCHKKGDPCKISVVATLPLCGHSQTIKCYEDAAQVACTSRCERVLPCGHQCDKACGEKCTTQCLMLVDKRRYCDHTLRVQCCQNVSLVVCPEACESFLKCGHKCTNRCGEPCEERCQVKEKIVLDCGHSYTKKCSSTKDVHCRIQVERTLLCNHTAIMPCGEDPALFVCKKKVPCTLPCGHKNKLVCSEIAAHQCMEPIIVKQPCGHPVKRACADKGELPHCLYPCQRVLACGHLCPGTCGQCFMGRLHVQCSQNVTLTLPCGHFSHMRCNEQYGKYHCKAKCEFSCHHRVCQKGKVPCDGMRCPSLSCSQPCSWSCPHVRCEKMCKELCGVSPCDQPCPKPLRCKHPCEGLCGEVCPAICRQCSKRNKKKSKSQAQMGHPVTKDGSCRFIQLRCNHIFEVPHLDRYMRGKEDSREKKVSIKVCLKCHKPIYGIHRYHDMTKNTLQLLRSIESEQRPLQIGLQRPVPSFLSPAHLRLIKKAAHNPIEASHLCDSHHLPLPESRRVVGSVFGAQQCEIMSQIISYMNVILYDLMIDSDPVIHKHAGSDILTEVLASFYHLNTFDWPGTPQGIHDWVKETTRLQLLICLLICKLQANSGRKEVPLPVLDQLQRTLCEPPRVKGAAGGGALSLRALQQVQDKLFDMSPGHKMTLISDIKLPRFSSTEWYECERGHLYCKFTKSDLKIDIFHHLQDGCPVCSKVQLEHHCTIVPK